jgi:hypothetical protein
MAGSDDAVFHLNVPSFAESLTGNKRIAWETLRAFLQGAHEAGMANLADDITWLIPGSMKTSGLLEGKDAVRKFQESVKKAIFRDLERTIAGIYGDGDIVVSEQSAKGHLRNGEPYENASCFVWEFQDGKVKHIREYTDTQKAMAVDAVADDW